MAVDAHDRHVDHVGTGRPSGMDDVAGAFYFGLAGPPLRVRGRVDDDVAPVDGGVDPLAGPHVAPHGIGAGGVPRQAAHVMPTGNEPRHEVRPEHTGPARDEDGCHA